MKKTRFIELLNLYVDHQLDPSEAVELEGELQRNPARRRTYQQYCRMQKACTVLFESERTNAPSTSILTRALAEADRKIVAFPQGGSARPAWWRSLYAVGGLAAAACVAFIIVHTTSTVAPAPSQPAASPTVATALPTPEADAVVAIPAPKSLAPSFYNISLNKPFVSVVALSDKGSLMASTEPSNEADNLKWAEDVQLRPIRKVNPDELFINSSLTIKPVSAPSILRIQPDTQNQPMEMSAFQFVK